MGKLWNFFFPKDDFDIDAVLRDLEEQKKRLQRLTEELRFAEMRAKQAKMMYRRLRHGQG